MSDRAARLTANTDRIDTKATTLLGFVLAAVTFLASEDVNPWVAVPAYLGFAGAAFYGVQAMKPRGFKEVPEPGPLMQQVSRLNEKAALTVLSEAKRRAVDMNREQHEHKAACWKNSMRLLAVAVMLAVAALLLGGSDDGERRPHPSGGQPTPSATP